MAKERGAMKGIANPSERSKITEAREDVGVAGTVGVETLYGEEVRIRV